MVSLELQGHRHPTGMICGVLLCHILSFCFGRLASMTGLGKSKRAPYKMGMQHVRLRGIRVPVVRNGYRLLADINGDRSIDGQTLRVLH